MNASGLRTLHTRLALLLLVIACLAAVGSAGCSGSQSREAHQRPSDTRPIFQGGGRRYVDELAQLEASIAALRARAQRLENQPSAYEQLAGAHLQHARLTGDYADYAAAESLIARAFALSPPGAGPFLSRARLNLTLHRLDRVEPDLQAEERAVMLDDGTRAEILGLRASVALHSGRYAEALRDFESADRTRRSIGSVLNLATYHWQTGDFDRAASLLDSAAAMYHGRYAEPRAWVHLQRGLMDLDRGRLDSALAHYERADSVLSGWWLIQEHIAEVDKLAGRTREALALYEDIVERTGNPEFMDAIAEIHRAQGDSAAAQPWIDRAEEIYVARLSDFPEAAVGHALDHWLEFEPDVDRVIQLAERNYRLRPGGEAGLKLAQAYLRAGRLDAAQAAIERVLATPWTSLDLHMTAARIYEAAASQDRSAQPSS